MKRFNQYEPFNISLFTLSEWPYPLHNHNHFEIIFIHAGEGVHVVNEHRFDYRAGDVFLLGPEDHHLFRIRTPTEFCYIRFTDLFFRGDKPGERDKDWQQTVEYLFHAPYQASGSLVKDPAEKERLDHLRAVLLAEYHHRGAPFAEHILGHLLQSIISILARNITAQALDVPAEGSRSRTLEEILAYVRRHIHEPDQLRLDALAAHFRYAPNYLSIFFKRQTGESLQQYILRYKLKLVEARLRYSDWSVSEIAYAFGFTDESHLGKLFKKYYGRTPRAFRESERGAAPSLVPGPPAGTNEGPQTGQESGI